MMHNRSVKLFKKAIFAEHLTASIGIGSADVEENLAVFCWLIRSGDAGCRGTFDAMEVLLLENPSCKSGIEFESDLRS